VVLGINLLYFAAFDALAFDALGHIWLDHTVLFCGLGNKLFFLREGSFLECPSPHLFDHIGAYTFL